MLFCRWWVRQAQRHKGARAWSAVTALPPLHPPHTAISTLASAPQAKYPLVASSDCTVDMKQEIIDVCVTAVVRAAPGSHRVLRHPSAAATQQHGVAAPANHSPPLLPPTLQERHAADMERCTQAIKEALDRRYGAAWHVVVGRTFAFKVTHEVGVRCAGRAG